jgi:hypothetical protein
VADQQRLGNEKFLENFLHPAMPQAIPINVAPTGGLIINIILARSTKLRFSPT